MIEIGNISKYYDDIHAIDGITATIKEGGVRSGRNKWRR